MGMTMESFFSLLEHHIQVQHTLVCVGLDPHLDDLPVPTAEAAYEFCVRLIRATAPYAAAFKPNAAFFEQLGPEGWTALKRVIEAAQAESRRIGSVIPVILDAKRGDIASTADAYAYSTFSALGAQALTASPYLGHDSLAPFVADREKGVFVLCKTSNPGAGDVQEATLANGQRVYEHVAALAQTWNINGNVGLVVGATDPAALARVRALAPEMWFLVPGIGAQGGDLETTLAAGLRPDGLGLLVSASRSIARAQHPGNEARRLRDEIYHYRGSLARHAQRPKGASSPPISALAQDLIESQCVRFGQFTLKSGAVSPIYLDLRRLITHPQILARAAKMYATKLRDLQFDRLAGIPYAGLPIATAISLAMNRPLIYPRREAKDYGTKAAIEGDFNAGETIAVIDDLATTGGTKIESIQKLESAGLKVKDIVVLIDREQGAGALLSEAGYRLHAVVTLPELLEVWRESGAITRQQFDEVTAFLKR